MATLPPAQPPPPPSYAMISPIWDKVEPRWDYDGAPPVACYCKRQKADLLPGTFVLLSNPGTTADESRNTAINIMYTGIVARIISADSSSRPRTSVQVNIFKELSAFAAADGSLHPKLLVDKNHLQHLHEVMQTEELQVISSDKIINLAFVFVTISSLQDSCNLFFTCQGMFLS
jgi:hypothetical protein